MYVCVCGGGGGGGGGGSAEEGCGIPLPGRREKIFAKDSDGVM